jgi:hypothetical protein
MRTGPGPRCSLDGFDGDLLYLRLRLFALLFASRQVGRLPHHNVFNSPDAQLRQGISRFAAFRKNQDPPFKFLLGGADSYGRSLLRFTLEPGRKFCGFFANALDLLLARS